MGSLFIDSLNKFGDKINCFICSLSTVLYCSQSTVLYCNLSTVLYCILSIPLYCSLSTVLHCILSTVFYCVVLHFIYSVVLQSINCVVLQSIYCVVLLLTDYVDSSVRLCKLPKILFYLTKLYFTRKFKIQVKFINTRLLVYHCY